MGALLAVFLGAACGSQEGSEYDPQNCNQDAPTCLEAEVEIGEEECRRRPDCVIRNPWSCGRVFCVPPS